MATYTVPDSSTDPEAAALELIVRLPGDILDRDLPPRDVLQEFASVLEVEGAFAGLSWHDAKHAAVAIIADVLGRDDAASFLRHRASLAATGADGMTWDDREAMVRALTIGAKVVDL